MFRTGLPAALMLGLAVPAVAQGPIAQSIPVRPVSGTLLEVVATGEVSRVPDIAIINAGVDTRAPTATEAIRQNAARMERVIAALEAAGVEERDIQTSVLNLHPEYRYENNRPPELTGYQAMNQLSVRFRDIENAGRILDALVSVGANRINGPMLSIDEPEEALDEARVAALRNARARADLYAAAAGMRVARLLSISEAGGFQRPYPVPVMRAEMAQEQGPDTRIVPGEQTLSVSLSVAFELE
ncbi:MAG: SIMPL domain-containing protein [Sphingomonadaceae bacterium]